MVSQKVTVKNEQGLHMRPAGMIAKKVKEFADCTVTMNVGDKVIKAKAPMQIMAAGLKKGTELELVCDGAGESEALAALVEMFEDGFGE